MVNQDPLEQARHWRARADEIRAVAEQMGHPLAREDLFRVARMWDSMALESEQRARRHAELIARPPSDYSN
jgi:hypothetical protein